MLFRTDIIKLPLFIHFLVNKHLCKYPTNIIKKYQKKNYLKFLRLFIYNLFESNNISGYLLCNLSPNQYNKKTIPSANKFISYTRMKLILDQLYELEMITIEKGFLGRDGRNGKLTKIKPTPKLIGLFKKYNTLDNNIVFASPIIPVVLKDNTKNIIKIDESKYKHIITPIILINKCYDVIDIKLDTTGLILNKKEETKIKTLLKLRYISNITESKYNLNHYKHIKRVFNNSSFSYNGRLYNPVWQNLSSRLRKKILLNNEQCTSIDIQASLVRLMYHVSGNDYIMDPYIIPKFGLYREDVKQLFIIMLNTTTKQSCKKAAYQTSIFLDIPKEYRSSVINDCIDSIEKTHTNIKKYFYNQTSLSLERIESEICLKNIISLGKLNIPCLTIHDEYIVPLKHSDESKSIIKENYKNILKFDPILK